MDLIVSRAMAKWPNVPDCYGWLGLDARGRWRMRDERAQALGQAGDKLEHAALIGFINRNYNHDARGYWYFQNGPQRVFVNLEVAPYIARADTQLGLTDHTGRSLAPIERVWLSDAGHLWFDSAGSIAMLDDRDLSHCLAALKMDGASPTDEQLMAWLEDTPIAGALTFTSSGKALPVARLAQSGAADIFGFVAHPQPAAVNHKQP